MPTTQDFLISAKGRLCGFDWFAINEWVPASLLLMYESNPFDRLLPSPYVFGQAGPNFCRAHTSTDFVAGFLDFVADFVTPDFVTIGTPSE